MATPTYTLIEEQVLGSSTASVTFTSIPSTYKDLVLEVVCTGSTSFADVKLTFNDDAGSNYSRTILDGNGSSASSWRNSNATSLYAAAATPTVSTHTIALMSYANTSTYKTALARVNIVEGDVQAVVGVWRSTSAVTKIALTPTAGTLSAASSFRLWGIA